MVSKDGLLETTQQLDEDSIVVCTTDAIPKKKSDLKTALQKADRVEEYALLSDNQLVRWIHDTAQRNNLTLARPVISYLQDAIGNDLWAMHHVIQQLAHFGIEPTLQTVQLFVQSPIDDNIFHLTDALSDKNVKLALKLLNDQFVAGANHFYILSMLARQIQVLIEVKETNGKGSSLHPYVIKKTLRYAQRFDLEQLHRFHTDLVEADYALKSSATDARLLLDTLLVRWTS